MRQILLQLAAGEMKSKIAEGLRISRGRLSQLLAKLAQEIVAFFGPEGLPELA
jgi:predicted XRE-type DNA-binding protein